MPLPPWHARVGGESPMSAAPAYSVTVPEEPSLRHLVDPAPPSPGRGPVTTGPRSQDRACGTSLRVLWLAADAEPTATSCVMGAAQSLRALGVDLRLRMVASRPVPEARPKVGLLPAVGAAGDEESLAPQLEWADTVLVADGGGRRALEVLADLGELQDAVAHVTLCTRDPGARTLGPATTVARASDLDPAALATLWLDLAEGGAPSP